MSHNDTENKRLQVFDMCIDAYEKGKLDLMF